ncbi:MAG TPA: lipoprotein insertase outer membrane protein LolB [Agitococcus sp.]|uniref:lipoprotein insertase outer membrane protein LolB n=1 Tax=uncultured Agitococcus sp. TaxID=1506599 RepID=UPI0026301101|nr:lipoprotein insertase outer membrane protein LolB [uncultured Agitococcus sp.]HRH90821.1 lipoprotein insertase outer membrane protein LolB [Agitococcus sp.]
MRHFFTATSLILLSGCASQSAILHYKEAYTVPTPAPIAEQHPLAKLEIAEDVDSVQLPALNPLSMWTASGKLAVKMIDENGSKKGGSAYFNWQQDTQDYRIILIGPLGQGRTTLIGNSKGVILQSAKTGEVTAQTPEALFEQAFGWTAPVSYLKFWLEGRPATTDAVLNYTTSGQLESVREGNWQADFKNYRYINSQFLPQKIVVTGPNVNMTVLINEWQPQIVATQ